MMGSATNASEDAAGRGRVSPEDRYADQLERESAKWGRHLQVESSGEWNGWLDHPLIRRHYNERAEIDGQDWKQWIRGRLGGVGGTSLDLGCGSGTNSMRLWELASVSTVEGMDISRDRIAEAERLRVAAGAPGEFRAGDVNTVRLHPSTYDVIFSAFSFHHFLSLEHVMEQVSEALTDRGLFILEEFVGPTQFQWTDEQMDHANELLGTLPEALRTFRDGRVKTAEGRPTPEEVVAVSPFESIRSSEIRSLFGKYFVVEEARWLGGTIQHLLYNGISHNFNLEDESALQHIRRIYRREDELVDLGRLPSDFMLLVGHRRG